MSLMDAMLNEGYRDRRDVYLALRTDGAKGSGTIDDPYDGSAFQENIRSAVVGKYLNDQTGRTAFVVLTSHGFSDGDLVAIRGATNSQYNGNFFIFNTTADQFFYMMGAAPSGGAGSATTCAGVALRFDEVMESTPASAAIHIGPGVFETKGYSPPSPAWQPKAGQKIRGSGMGATTLKLVGARAPISGAGQPTHAIGAHYYPPLDHLEIADMTIDCNLPGQIAPQGKEYAEVSCGAISVPGSHTRVQRVRAINFGTQVLDVECFVMALAGKHPNLPEIVGSTIEGCVIERPSPNNFRETTCFMMGGQTPAQHRGCVIRHSLVNCLYPPTAEHPAGVSSEMVAIANISHVEGTQNQYLVRTNGPHLRQSGNNVVIGNVQVFINNSWQVSTVFNGVFAIDEITSANEFTYTLKQARDGTGFNLQNATIGVDFHAFGVEGGTAAVAEGNWAFHTRLGYYTDTGSSKDSIVRDNVFYDVVTGPYLLLGNLMDPPITGSKVENPYPAQQDIALFTCPTAHGLWAGVVVEVSNVWVGSPPVLSEYFNGLFEVQDVPTSPVHPYNGNPTTFTYMMKGVPPDLPISEDIKPQFRELYRSRSITVENNLIILSPSLQSDASPSIGIDFARFEGTYPYIFDRVMLKDNVVAHRGEVRESRAIAITQVSVERGLAEQNICRLAAGNPMTEWPTPVRSRIRYLNNLGDANQLAEGSTYYGADDQRSISDIEATVEMALLLSL